MSNGRLAAADMITAIHEFWFGELDENGLCNHDHHALWFGASDDTDAFCREQFGAALSLALDGKLAHWTQTDRGLIALIVLLDQFSRNIHRGSAQAFAGDPLALKLAQDAINSGRHERLPPVHRVFLYLPLEHSETLALQEQCVGLFEQLAQQHDDPQFAGYARYANAHREVIARFGRFVHRNAILGRESSVEELAYLEQHGGF